MLHSKSAEEKQIHSMSELLLVCYELTLIHCHYVKCKKYLRKYVATVVLRWRSCLPIRRLVRFSVMCRSVLRQNTDTRWVRSPIDV